MKQSFRKLIPSYQGAAPVLIGLLFSVTIVCTFYGALHWPQKFPDLVTGLVAFTGVDKAIDTRCFRLLLAGLIVIPIAISYLIRLVAPDGPQSPLGRAVQQLLLLSLVPAAWRLAISLAIAADGVPPFQAICLFPATALIAILLLRRYRKSITPEQLLATGGTVLLIVLLSIFAGFSIGVFFTRLIPATVSLFNGTGYSLAGAGIGISFAAIVVFQVLSPTIEESQQKLLGWLKGMQYPLVLLFFHLVPPPFIDARHLFNERYPWLLVLVLSVGVIVSWFLIYRRHRRTVADYLPAIHRHPLARALSPTAVAAVIVFVYCGSAQIPSAYPDYFHWGEQVLPWQQLVDFHKIPYVEFVPIHGLMAYLRGGFSSVFFDGTAASYTGSDILLTGLTAVVLAVAASYLVSPLGALVLLMGTLPHLDRTYFVAPAIFIIAAPQILHRPRRLLISWLIVSALMIGYNAGLGCAFAVGTLPIIAWGTWRAIFTDRWWLVGIATTVFALLAILYSIAPVRQIAVAFVTFIVDNGWTNEVAHGIAWSQCALLRSPTQVPGTSQFIWEVTKYSWILFALLAAAMFWKYAGRSSEEPGDARSADSFPIPNRRSLLVMCAAITPMFLLCSPWLLCRLEPGELGRSGAISHVSMYMILAPLMLLAIRSKNIVHTLLWLAVLIGIFYPSNPTIIEPSMLAQKCVMARRVDPNIQVTDGSTIGMPRLGKVITPSPNFLIDLQNLKTMLDQYLKPGETYLDLTNLTAIYYYLNLPDPVRYAPFVAANTRLQAGILKQLAEHPVHAVLVGPSGWLDQVPPTLRSYFLFRKYAPRFSLVRDNFFTMLVDPARAPNAPVAGSEAQLANLDLYCFKDNLRRIPASWGESWRTLKPLFTHVADVDPASAAFLNDLKYGDNATVIRTGPVPYYEFPIPKEASIGETADFLRLHFIYASTDGKEPRIQICFVTQSGGKYSQSFTLDAPQGSLLIPMGAYPRWLLAKDLMTIRFDFLNAEQMQSFRMGKIEFLHLNDPTVK